MMNVLSWKKLVGAAVVTIGLLWSGNCVATEFDPYGTSSDSYGSSSYGRSQSNDQLDRYRQEQNRQREEAYRRSAEEYARKPAYESGSTWVQTPSGKAMECVKDVYGAGTVTCY